jgi:hypothetical protein
LGGQDGLWHHVVKIWNYWFSSRAVDVEHYCIVNLDRGARFVALSYTWSRRKYLTLTKRTEHFLRERSNLQKCFAELPLTIQDTILMVQLLGEKFLWVDSLCILQDDNQDKEDQIEEMGKAYSEILLAIFAACGTDSAYGLLGVRPGTRKIEQIAEKVGSIVLANLLPPTSETSDLSTWNTRG